MYETVYIKLHTTIQIMKQSSNRCLYNYFNTHNKYFYPVQKYKNVEIKTFLLLFLKKCNYLLISFKCYQINLLLNHLIYNNL